MVVPSRRVARREGMNWLSLVSWLRDEFMSIEFKERSKSRSDGSSEPMSTLKQLRLVVTWVTLIVITFETIFICK
jgi:hypothetical protein